MFNAINIFLNFPVRHKVVTFVEKGKFYFFADLHKKLFFLLKHFQAEGKIYFVNMDIADAFYGPSDYIFTTEAFSMGKMCFCQSVFCCCSGGFLPST